MEQLHRVNRYLLRIQNIYDGCPHQYKYSKYYEDDVVSFFIHCHHLLDWLIINNPSGFTKKELNIFVNSHIELQICADICNGKKHCKLNRTRSGGLPELNTSKGIIITYTKETGKPVTFFGTYNIIHHGVTYDVLELANTCINLWQSKIREMALKVI